MNTNKPVGKSRSLMGIPALVLALILPLKKFISETLVIRAGILMESEEDH